MGKNLSWREICVVLLSQWEKMYSAGFSYLFLKHGKLEKNLLSQWEKSGQTNFQQAHTLHCNIFIFICLSNGNCTQNMFPLSLNGGKLIMNVTPATSLREQTISIRTSLKNWNFIFLFFCFVLSFNLFLGLAE